MPMVPTVFPAPARPRVGHDTLIVTVTPSKAAAYGQCPLYFREVHEKRAPHVENRAIQRGQYLHALLERYNQARIEGRRMGVDEVIVRVPMPTSFRDSGDDERDAIAFARASLRGHELWLDEQDFAALVSAEQYIRTAPRSVAGVDGAAIVLSGRIDLVALTRDGLITFVDFKSSNIPPAEVLQASPAAFVQGYLGEYAYASDNIEILQLVPSTGQTSRVRLTGRDIEAGAALCRAMVKSIKDDSYPPHPGSYCAFCDHAVDCPAFTGRGDMVANPF